MSMQRRYEQISSTDSFALREGRVEEEINISIKFKELVFCWVVVVVVVSDIA